MTGSPTTASGTTWALARFAADIRYEDLPSEAVATLKQLFLDTVATSLAGTTLGAGCAEVAKVVRAAAGTPESTLIGFGLKAAALTAAFANGATAHALNYDALGGDGGHLGVTTLPAPLAAAERRGGVPGKALLAAMGAAAEVTARLAAALSHVGINPNRKFLEGQVLGYFGAAVGAGKVMGLSAEHMHSALGVALMQAGGTMQVVLEGDPPAKAIYGGFANLGGMLAALLSQQGLGAHIQAIEGDAGLYGLFYDGRYAQEVIESGLGRVYLLQRARFKPWPTSGVVHPFIEAASLLAQR
ncbi:MAG: MmgE/PrpD family protein, partial [Nitrospinae bacterium]|nr:MmgE/PrpD family protein [Nitrospinota bacterium]